LILKSRYMKHDLTERARSLHCFWNGKLIGTLFIFRGPSRCAASAEGHLALPPPKKWKVELAGAPWTAKWSPLRLRGRAHAATRIGCRANSGEGISSPQFRRRGSHRAPAVEDAQLPQPVVAELPAVEVGRWGWGKGTPSRGMFISWYRSLAQATERSG
jgi:hypothetical protein